MRAVGYCIVTLFAVSSCNVYGQPPVNVSGSWSSNLGAVSFSQAGDRVSGTLRFSTGAVAQLSGAMQGNTLRYSWSINQGAFGDGTLTIVSDRQLTGRYFDQVQRQGGPFTLTRVGAAPAMVPGAGPQANVPGQQQGPVVSEKDLQRRQLIGEIIRQFVIPNETSRNGQPSMSSDRTFVAPSRAKPESTATAKQSALNVEPRVPGEAELKELPTGRLNGFLLASIRQLNSELDSLSTGASWHDYLQLRMLEDTLNASENRPLSTGARLEFSAAASKFTSVKANPDLKQIWSLWGFRAVHAALPVAAADPAFQQLESTQQEFAELDAALLRMSTGEQWRSYLSINGLPKPMQLQSGLPPEERQALDDLLDRYDGVARAQQFAVIADMPEFQSAHEGLSSLVSRLVLKKLEQTPNPQMNLAGGADLFRLGRDNVRDRRDVKVLPSDMRTQRILHWDIRSVPEARAVVWQVSRSAFRPFFASDADLSEVGMVTSGTEANSTGSFVVDVAELVRSVSESAGTSVVKLDPFGSDGTRNGFPKLPTMRIPLKYITAGGSIAFYVRAIPVVSVQQPFPAGQPSNVIRVWYGHKPPGEHVAIDPTHVDPVAQQFVDIEHLVEVESVNLDLGRRIYFNPSACKNFKGGGPTFEESVNEGVRDFATGIEDGWNFVAQHYQELKSTVVDVTATALSEALDQIPGVPNLKDEISTVLATSLDGALASLGIPPNLPTTHELLEANIDAVAETMLNESGVPGFVNAAIEAGNIPAVFAGDVEKFREEMLGDAKESIKSGLRSGIDQTRKAIARSKSDKEPVKLQPCSYKVIPTTVTVVVNSKTDKRLSDVRIVVVANEVFDGNYQTIAGISPKYSATVTLGLGRSTRDEFTKTQIYDTMAWVTALRNTAFAIHVVVYARVDDSTVEQVVGRYTDTARNWYEINAKRYGL